MSQQTTKLRDRLIEKTEAALDSSLLYGKVVNILEGAAEKGQTRITIGSGKMNELHGETVSAGLRCSLIQRLLKEGVEAEYICEDRPCGSSYYEFGWAD